MNLGGFREESHRGVGVEPPLELVGCMGNSIHQLLSFKVKTSLDT